MKKILICVVVSAVLVFGFPALVCGAVITCVPAAAFLLVAYLFVIIPLLMVFIGIFTGGEFKRLWFTPIIPAVMFFAAIWFFSGINTVNILFACSYLAVGIISGLLAFLVKKQKIKNKGKENG